MNIARALLASFITVLVLGAGALSPVWAQPAVQSPDIDPLAGLKSGHPRLLFTDADWAGLRERQKTDPDLARLIAQIEADAKSLVGKPPLSYKKQGKRLLDVSRQAEQRILLWSFAYRLTGDQVYADRAKKELLDVAAFDDWDPSHFLDTAEMTAAVAFGYDWLYDQLDPGARDIIRHAIVEKGLEPGLDPQSKFLSWQHTANNWNQVCFGGLALGALAVGDEAPAPARAVLERARANISYGLQPYAPDGIYPEGPNYWDYGTSYQVLMLAALQSALGTTWQLENVPGFLSSAAAQVELTGPTGKVFNFSDGGESVGIQPAMYWFARQLHQPGLLCFQARQLAATLARSPKLLDPDHGRLLPLLPFWWTSLSAAQSAPELPLDWHGDGPNPVGVFRSSWTDTNALFLAFKGGSPGHSHAHMDAGSFVLDADGVRWASDLGMQDYYSLESKNIDLWNGSQNGGRWTVFRLNNFSHNTLTIGNQLHRVKGDARITEFNDGANPNATVDLSAIFDGQATRVTRHFELGPDRTVTIHDELTGLTPGASVRWAMVTRAKVQLSGSRAVLKQSGKELHASLLAPADATFSVISADPPADDYDAPNPNTRILIATVAAPASGQLDLTVTLHPGSL